jgi:hypothetical protein
VAAVSRALTAKLEHLQRLMPLTTAAVSPHGFASLRRTNSLLHLSLLDALSQQDTVYSFWVTVASQGDAEAAAAGRPSTSLSAELKGRTFDRTCAQLMQASSRAAGGPPSSSGPFDSLYGIVRVGELATLVVRKNFIPTGVGAASELTRALSRLTFLRSGALDIASAVADLAEALGDTEDSGVAIDAATALSRIDAEIAFAAHHHLSIVTASGESTVWSLWATRRARAAARRGQVPVSLSEVHDVLAELMAFGVTQSLDRSALEQAIAGGRSDADPGRTAGRYGGASVNIVRGSGTNHSGLCGTENCAA